MKTEIDDYLKENHLSYNSAIRNDVGELVSIGNLIDQNTKPLINEIYELRKTGLEAIKIAEDLSASKKKYETRVEELQEQLANSESQHTITLEKLRFVTDKSKSEVNESVEFAEWTYENHWVLNQKSMAWYIELPSGIIDLSTGKNSIELYEIFKNKNKTKF